MTIEQIISKKSNEVQLAKELSISGRFNGVVSPHHLLKYKKFASRFEEDDFDIEKVHESMCSGYLKKFVPIKVDIKEIKPKETLFDQLVIEDEELEIILIFNRCHLKGDSYSLTCYYSSTSTLSLIELHQKELTPLLKEKDINSLGSFRVLVKDTYGNIEFKKAAINPKEVDIERMYTDGVKKFNTKLISQLASNEAGLYILHGPPGTGKTSFINHLIQKVEKDFIFIPSNLVDSLLQPDFIELLWSHANAIIVIEDAEKALQKRTNTDYSPVSSLLNITDGLMGDILNLKVICTLNSELQSLDEALLRKGRLKGKCFFGNLDQNKANALSLSLGKETIFTNDTPLADIFQNEENVFGETQLKAIGFN